MEVTLTELGLFAWGMVATLLWQQARHNYRMHRTITGEVFKRIADGRIKVVEKEDSFDIVEVSK